MADPLYDEMLHTLLAAISERPQRRAFVKHPVHGSVFQWELHERRTMTRAVNYHRAARGLPGIDTEEMARVETLAQGHSDYAHKLAWYCTELAKGISPFVRG